MAYVRSMPSWAREAPVSVKYSRRQIVRMDLHRHRLVLVRMTEAGQRGTIRISNDRRFSSGGGPGSPPPAPDDRRRARCPGRVCHGRTGYATAEHRHLHVTIRSLSMLTTILRTSHQGMRATRAAQLLVSVAARRCEA